MPKTAFTDGDPALGILGTLVLAAWLNKVFAHRHDGADADGSAPLDYAVDSSVVANSVILNFTLPLTAHVPGMPILFRAAHTNTGPTTLAIVTAAGAPYILKEAGGFAHLAAGDIKAGQLVLVAYDGANYYMLSGLSSIADSAKLGGKQWVNIAQGSQNLAHGAWKTVNLTGGDAAHRFYRISVFSDYVAIVEGYQAGVNCYFLTRNPTPTPDVVQIAYGGADLGLRTFYWSIDEWK